MGADDHKEKTTKMVLKVNLECRHCIDKVKKILSKMPEVRDQLYDEKANTITIVVVCCSPERIRDKLCCKGGKTIKSIEIKEPEKLKVSDKKPKGPEKIPKIVTFAIPEEKPKDKMDKPKEISVALMVAPPRISEPILVMPPVQGHPQCGCGQCYYTGGPYCYEENGQVCTIL